MTLTHVWLSQYGLTACAMRVQSWAQLEEEQGLYQRASELRNFSLQEQTSFVPRLNLGTQPDDPILTSVFKQVSVQHATTIDIQSITMHASDHCQLSISVSGP